MNKKFIVVAVVLLLVAILFAACKKDDFKADPEQSTKPEITTNVDEKGAYVFNKNNEKVYLLGEDGFYIEPEDAVNMSPSKGEDGFYVGNATDGEKVPSINWDDIEKNS